eukprot:CAMPEP_0173421338 /NCGR_PEP_ID=MMETSP1357-20121228/2494_1 /TAXON_ID=77926 /ORGANISM="Hemiselmis rufescens, Strain PCC563" /LENGTH=125 /DNA_ID=CAMNT_0014384243 /DNA_START=22 /DNA_END=395 /DNA_ORIENTATION=+
MSDQPGIDPTSPTPHAAAPANSTPSRRMMGRTLMATIAVLGSVSLLGSSEYSSSLLSALNALRQNRRGVLSGAQGADLWGAGPALPAPVGLQQQQVAGSAGSPPKSLSQTVMEEYKLEKGIEAPP